MALGSLGSEGCCFKMLKQLQLWEITFCCLTGPHRNKQRVGELLASFFAFYGFTFSIPSWVVTIRTTKRVTKQDDVKFKEELKMRRFAQELKSSPDRSNTVFSYRPGPRWRFYVEDPFEVWWKVASFTALLTDVSFAHCVLDSPRFGHRTFSKVRSGSHHGWIAQGMVSHPQILKFKVVAFEGVVNYYFHYFCY